MFGDLSWPTNSASWRESNYDERKGAARVMMERWPERPDPPDIPKNMFLTRVYCVRWQTKTFITRGAVCAKWCRGPWYETQEGFGMVTIQDGRVQWEYKDIGWEALLAKKVQIR